MKGFNLLAVTPRVRMGWFQRPPVACYPAVTVMLSPYPSVTRRTRVFSCGPVFSWKYPPHRLASACFWLRCARIPKEGLSPHRRLVL